MTGDGQLTRHNNFSRGARFTQHSVAEPVGVRTSDLDPSSRSRSTSLSRLKCHTWPTYDMGVQGNI